MTNRVSIICKGNEILVDWDTISHVSKYGHEVVIYTETENYRTRHSIKEILDALPTSHFFRIHRSHVISLRYLEGYKRRRVGVNGCWLPISNYFKVSLLKKLREEVDQHCRFHDQHILPAV